ncbi:carboxypeptidase-like regulatory domain-containing protein [Deinococcus cellulosilyticus]|uniref:Carboxypeptidase regulatory-like domain-containing protein n=1 Tax=Deinococcus cellulosilyticus (strain DSM 18568 / NBRC 106333 / KACC 11606 / 5516J-15) TaxID=1223518 RepID=A0A511N8U5_DEIC1|nr:carboxypeptidase-like regulatory domain-containing protein [Deinococcus cellulosilyticus]GEM49265.1 hypothetical protein DC3_49000 [Deinococcus cellulosilyticus NBRC 106333 = KACC 11606]
MKKTLAITLSTLLFSAGAALAQQSVTVSGVVLGTGGKPIPKAKVIVRPALTTGQVDVRTNANGKYEAAVLPRLPYRAYANAEFKYLGKTYCLRVAPEKSEGYEVFTPTKNLVRNFKLKLSGEIEDLENGFWGGEIRLFRRDVEQGDTAELTFTPQGPLIDGSTGKVLRKTEDEYLMVYDIPIGRYKVSGVLRKANGSKIPLLLSNNDDQYQNEALFEFKPSGCSVATHGIERGFLYYKPVTSAEPQP